MTLLAPIALFGWVPLSIMLFAFLKPVRAMTYGFIGAWLLLPIASFDLPGFPGFDKSTSASVGVLLGIFSFDALRLTRLRLRLIDVPVLTLCASPLFTAVDNGLGLYEGISDVWAHLIVWGVPYLAGRLYLVDLESLRELALGILLGAVVYLPLCLLEVRLSPQLHHWCYGYHQHSFAQHVRYGGFRPMVFMQHGLMVAFWMAAGTVVAYWCWLGRMVRSQSIQSMLGWIFVALAIATVLCKSGNALILMPIGIGFFHACRLGFGRLVMIALIAAPLIWMTGRGSGLIASSDVVGVVEWVDADRAQSLAARLKQEELFGAKAMQRPLLGWGRYARMFPVDEQGKNLTRGVDALWTITFGQYGIVGLVSTVGLILLGPIRVMLFGPGGAIRSGDRQLLVFLFAVLCILCMIDCLFNSMINPVFIAAAAGLAGIPLESRLITPRPVTIVRPVPAARSSI